MRCGEITGQPFDNSDMNVGMPFRSVSTMRKHDKNNNGARTIDICTSSNVVNDKFEYYDPSENHFSGDIMPTNNHGHTQPTICDKFPERIKNISVCTTDYVNNVTCDMYNKILHATRGNF